MLQTRLCRHGSSAFFFFAWISDFGRSPWVHFPKAGSRGTAIDIATLAFKTDAF